MTCKLKWALLSRLFCEVRASLLSVFSAKRTVTFTATSGHVQTDHKSDIHTINDHFYPVFLVAAGAVLTSLHWLSH